MKRIVGGVAAAHLLLVAGLMLVLGYPLVGPYGAVGLLLVGAAAAVLHRSHRWPAGVVLAAVVTAVLIELRTPGPLIATLGSERVTTGVPVLDRYVEGWPVLLATALLAALVEHRPRPRRWLAASMAVAVTVTVLVLLAGVARGWLAAPPIGLAYGLPALFVLALVATLLRIRTGIVAPTLLLGLALGVATVTSWVQPVGDPTAGLVASSAYHLVFALLWGLVEWVVRTVVRRRRAARTPACAAAADPAASPWRS